MPGAAFRVGIKVKPLMCLRQVVAWRGSVRTVALRPSRSGAPAMGIPVFAMAKMPLAFVLRLPAAERQAMPKELFGAPSTPIYAILMS